MERTELVDGVRCRLVICDSAWLWKAQPQRGPQAYEDATFSAGVAGRSVPMSLIPVGAAAAGSATDRNREAKRRKVIDRASAEYGNNSQAMRRARVTEQQWINAALQEADLPVLTDAEWRDMQGIPPEGADPIEKAKYYMGLNSDRPYTAAYRRAATILAACREFDEAGREASRLTCKSAWINDSLRLAGLALLTESERTRVDLSHAAR